MTRSADRDAAIDRVLRRAMQAADSTSASGCPDADGLAAWIDRGLPPTVLAALDAHLGTCSRCQDIVAVLGRTDAIAPAESVPASVPRAWWSWRLTWLVPVATAAVAVAVWVRTPEPATAPPAATESDSAVRTDVSAQPSESVVSARKQASTSSDQATASSGVVRENAQGTRSGGFSARAGEEPRLNAGAAEQALPLEGALGQNEQIAGLADRVAPPPSTTPPVASPPAAAKQALPSAPAPDAKPEAGGQASSLARARAFNEARREISVPVEPLVVHSPNPAVQWRFIGDIVQRTTSGGQSWATVTITPPASLTAGAAPSETVCWLVGAQGAVRRATDGVRFSAIAFPQPLDLVAVTATSVDSATVTARDRRAFHTDDGGATWMLVTAP